MRLRWNIVRIPSAPRPPRGVRAGLTLLLTLTSAATCQTDVDRAPARGAAPALTIARFPLNGVNGRDWVINGYVDVDPSPSGIADYRGRTGARARTYDGHQGIDIDIPSFREMDSGAAIIYAVAPGVVDQVVEDQPDRNIRCAGRWNLVRVRHASGLSILYGHIKRGSARVTLGQHVGVGTPLAIVGSAGCSTQPHLHLEIQDRTHAHLAIDPLSRVGMWAAPPQDDPASAVMDVMLRVGGPPTLAQIKDPAPDPARFDPGSLLGIGLSLAIRGGDRIAITLTAPDGQRSLQTFRVGEGVPFGHRYASAAFPVGLTRGRWIVEAHINDTASARRAFWVAPGWTDLLGLRRRATPAAPATHTPDPHL